mgnify:CR=1 FL=1|jgi:type IX secretion system PorP/SprF family membrane protein
MRTINLIAIICLTSMSAFAQQDAQSSMYFFNPLQFNPAYAGSRGSLNITGLTRAQWAGWDGAPRTQFLSIHAPIVRKHIGVGGNLSYDKIGSRSGVNAMATFAYHMQLNNDGLKLSLGASAGIQQNQFDFSSLQVVDNTDPNFLQSNSSLKANFGFGAYLYANKFYAGVSIPQLVKRSIDNNAGNSFAQRHLYVMAGYVFKLNSVVDIKPSLLMKYTGNGPLIADLNVSAHLYNKFWVGGMFRVYDAVGFNASYQIKDFCMVGYAYDFPINGKLINQWGSHEFVLSFDIRSKNNAFLSPRYF